MYHHPLLHLSPCEALFTHGVFSACALTWVFQPLGIGPCFPWRTSPCFGSSHDLPGQPPLLNRLSMWRRVVTLTLCIFLGAELSCANAEENSCASLLQTRMVEELPLKSCLSFIHIPKTGEVFFFEKHGGVCDCVCVCVCWCVECGI